MYQYKKVHVDQNWDNITLNILPTEELTKSQFSQEKKLTVLYHKIITIQTFFN